MANDLAVKYTRDDFLLGSAPYEELYKLVDDNFKLKQRLQIVSDMGKEVGVKNVKTLFKDYCAKIRQSTGQALSENVSDFDGQDFEIDTGVWTADDKGISRTTEFGEIFACAHPIMPTKKLINVDTGIVKLELAFKLGHQWRRAIFDKSKLASSNSIVSIADYGISVTSESAKYLVQYINEVENLNRDTIPELKSVSRLGWIGDEGFSPYVDNLIFDGDLSFKHYFESVRQKGSFDKWVRAVRSIRLQGNVPAKILVAASFASALVEPCGGLTFFVHLYGGTETGKTVGLMLAASVWADPAMGKYIHTFNSTQVAQELSAGFVNSMPLILDELQIVKDKKDFDQMIYQLSEGVGRARGKRTGGMDKMPTWKNCVITTGEQPIANSNSGGGAINRIIEIGCEDVRLFDDPSGLVKTIRENHGHAGRKFVEALGDPETMEVAKAMQEDFYQRIMRTDVTEKQALAASLILTADALIDGIIFKDNNGLTVEELSEFLSTHSEVSVHTRAYEWLKGWLVQHGSKFDEFNQYGAEVWGKYAGTNVCILSSKFHEACRENNFDPQTFLAWLKKNDLIETRVSGRGNTKAVRIGAGKPECVILKINEGFQDE